MKVAYDSIYVWGVKVILINMILGTIIETFAILRAESNLARIITLFFKNILGNFKQRQNN
jgi:hypothetical protein